MNAKEVFFLFFKIMDDYPRVMSDLIVTGVYLETKFKSEIQIAVLHSKKYRNLVLL